MLVADGLDLRSRGSPLRLKLLTHAHEAVSWGWVSRGGMIMAGTRARWRLTSVVGCHRVDQESTGAARAPIAPRHIFAGVHFVGGSRMRRPRSCTCGMLHCLRSGYVPRGLSRREARLSSGWVA